MKRSNWVLIGALCLSLGIIPLTGCVPQSQFEDLFTKYVTLLEENGNLKAQLQAAQSDLASAQSDLASAQADYAALTVECEASQNELAEIKEAYPPREFSSPEELEDWLLLNHVSAEPYSENASDVYAKALEIQQDALKDGYVISANFDLENETGEDTGGIC